MIGEEEATYSRGTTTSTSKSVFADMSLVLTNDPGQIEYGSRKLGIPAGTMHSLNAVSNCINWYISVKGDIKFWADIKDKYPVTVTPVPEDHLDMEFTVSDAYPEEQNQEYDGITYDENL